MTSALQGPMADTGAEPVQGGAVSALTCSRMRNTRDKGQSVLKVVVSRSVANVVFGYGDSIA